MANSADDYSLLKRLCENGSEVLRTLKVSDCAKSSGKKDSIVALQILSKLGELWGRRKEAFGCLALLERFAILGIEVSLLRCCVDGNFSSAEGCDGDLEPPILEDFVRCCRLLQPYPGVFGHCLSLHILELDLRGVCAKNDHAASGGGRRGLFLLDELYNLLSSALRGSRVLASDTDCTVLFRGNDVGMEQLGSTRVDGAQFFHLCLDGILLRISNRLLLSGRKTGHSHPFKCRFLSFLHAQ
mmetsp:Transcript_784/g.1010  ORF Transcript_784/g.1010 Transcript_784/m.1010 type:complete len:242 (+) Transcript_784:571-1296(+)